MCAVCFALPATGLSLCLGAGLGSFAHIVAPPRLVSYVRAKKQHGPSH